ncbi:glutathione S-transferase family protein [Nitratireductor pacificus]|uniref:Glutathione S-transferase domain-containing protein n=1 Tax=Nitratireductor pacificus pht-3B TaxID=391937 RepID=K2N879_9HYPH|nr:glutathione S-transferase family protein [Nitratireductor pacificus]EKF20318.1 glutathione S-transferase domain-containing protein [Nitratireductor pacificus pht-3B]
MPIKLYELVGRDEARPFSPHCWKVAFALAHKGLDFTTAPTPFTAIARIEDGASRIVPVIRDGDRLVADSFQIALYLEETYPDRPTLFAGEGGKALSRFVERWCNTALHGFIGPALLVDIHDRLDRADQAYFRETREARFGRSLEASASGREERLEGFRAALAPLRGLVEKQAFMGGEAPLFADYILAGALQWARVVSPFQLLDAQDPVAHWFERCLDLHGGLGRLVPAAA